MMEKDYCYDPYPSTKTATTTAKKKKPTTTSCCKCLQGDGKNNKRNKLKAFCTGLATNVGICILLFGYTLVGSVIFLAIEGGTTNQDQILATTSLATKRTANGSELLRGKIEAVRSKTVENIWDITVNLNILYRDNWTRLAAQEMSRFQDEIIRTLGSNLDTVKKDNHQRVDAVDDQTAEKAIGDGQDQVVEWTFAKSFLYSLTILTTIGYGSMAPKTTLGKAVTMGYAIFGIPLTLLYLSSVGSILSRIARGFFSRALCCCLCSNCGYCCYDEKRMEEKERRMRKKRQQMELQQQQQQMALQEPFYVRSSSGFSTATSCSTAMAQPSSPTKDSLTDSESIHGLAILAPIVLCLCVMFAYICFGTFVLFKLENCNLLDGFYFCFMSLTTIGFGNVVMPPFAQQQQNGGVGLQQPQQQRPYDSSTTVWFCSIYIMSGMALTAMCFNVVHDEIVHRLRHHESRSFRKGISSASFPDDLNASGMLMNCTTGGGGGGSDMGYNTSS